MKFLILDILKSRIDGSSTHRIELIENLHRIGQGVGVHVIVSDENIAKKMQSEGIIVHKIRIYYRFLFLIKYIRTLLHLRYDYPFDIIYTRNSTIGLIGMLIWIHHKTNLIYEVNTILPDECKISQHHYNIIENFWMRLRCYINTSVAKNADGIIAVTKGIKNELIRQGVDSKKIFVVENGANVDIFKPMDANISKGILGLDKNIHYVCFVGSLAPWQGVEYLINAAPSILKEIPETKFLIIGDGQMKEELISLAEKTSVFNKFIFTGSVPYEEVPTYINASDVCVALKSHLKSGYSTLKMYEYLACGKPIVASNEEGLGNVLEKTGSGIAVNRGSVENVSNAIIKLIKNKELRKSMGKNGRKLVLEKYTWNATVKQIIEACEQIIE